ncbi:hypothetical protein [Macrococcus armenti]|uniref:hypothetical protein n=1 Tax=Macrococcus armenti TaxID=2875764 RepID=UPI001CCEEC0A|nr:hypothetical protein [Macrococcus armenti]UBH14138.1 hypothetical protein LAU43_05435 [Macrococcus armenti]
MMKTIKRERQVRLDELLKYVWDNGIKNESFFTKESGGHISVDSDGDFCMYGRPHVNKDERFTITEEVVIDENITLDEVVIVQTKYFDGHKAKYITRVVNKSIKECKRTKDTTLHEVWTVNGNGIGDLIWSKGRGLVD